MSILTGPMRFHLDGQKELTAHKAVLTLPEPDDLYIPLVNGRAACTPTVKEGDEVKKNQPLLTVEAMKMETSIVAKEDGVIDKIYVKEGEKVSQGDLLVSFVQ